MFRDLHKRPVKVESDGLAIDPNGFTRMRTEAEKNFSALRQILRPGNPLGEDLLSYGATLEARFTALSLSFPDQQYIRKLFAAVNAERVPDAVERLRTRLSFETEYLDEYRDVGLYPYCLKAFPGKIQGAVIEFFTSPYCPDTRQIDRRGAKGAFSATHQKVYIRGAAPSPESQWRSIAETGAMPREFGVVDHELVHFQQYCEPDQRGNPQVVVQPDEVDHVLMETHAYEAKRSSPAFFHPRLDSRSDIVSIVAKATNETDIKKISHAYDLIHNLRLLGRCDAQIANVVATDRWDSESRTYPGLRREFKQLRAQTSGDKREFNAIVRALQTRFKIEQHYQRYLARTIALEVLQETLANKI